MPHCLIVHFLVFYMDLLNIFSICGIFHTICGLFCKQFLNYIRSKELFVNSGY